MLRCIMADALWTRHLALCSLNSCMFACKSASKTPCISLLSPVYLSMQWLDECIRLKQEAAQRQPDQQQQQQADGAEQQHESRSQQEAADIAQQQQQGWGALFAPVVGGASEAERVRSAQAAAERDVAGEPEHRSVRWTSHNRHCTATTGLTLTGATQSMMRQGVSACYHSQPKGLHQCSHMLSLAAATQFLSRMGQVVPFIC